LGFASSIDFSAQNVRYDGINPLQRLNALLNMDPKDYSAPMGVPGPLWEEKCFKAGRLAQPQHIEFWEMFVLKDHPEKNRLLACLRGMAPEFHRFTGRFAGRSYDCDIPPARVFKNNWPEGLTSTGETPEAWALKKVKEDVATGALIHWGTVGVHAPPKVVLPLTVELEKPRMIHDARFTNLWCRSIPFSLDKVSSVSETFQGGSFLGKYDHKAGYHALLFADKTREYFGFEIDGEYYVPAGGIFGWNELPEIYHSLHAALIHWIAQQFGIPALVYLDDALSGSRSDAVGDQAFASAGWSMEILVWMNFLAGYTISLKKSILKPCQLICFLGINVDTVLKVFTVPEVKKAKFIALVHAALLDGSISIQHLAKVAGKGISFMLAVGEAAKVFTREMFNELRLVNMGRKASKANKIVLTFRLRRVFQVWSSFLETFDGASWMNVMHSIVRIQTDASGRRWGGVLKHGNETIMKIGEEFNLAEMSLHIEAKEALAILKVIEGIAESMTWSAIEGKRLDVWIDNQPLAFALRKGASQMKTVHDVIEKLFWLKLQHNFIVVAIWWDTKANVEADIITRTSKCADWTLSDACFRDILIWEGPFSMDLMASSVNGKCVDGIQLPFFSQFFSPGTSGVNLLAQVISPGTYYCFPPPMMVLAVVKHVLSFPAVRLVMVAPIQAAGWMGIVGGKIKNLIHLPSNAILSHDLTAVSVPFGCWVMVSSI
jgi:hypothetical protein